MFFNTQYILCGLLSRAFQPFTRELFYNYAHGNRDLMIAACSFSQFSTVNSTVRTVWHVNVPDQYHAVILLVHDYYRKERRQRQPLRNDHSKTTRTFT